MLRAFLAKGFFTRERTTCPKRTSAPFIRVRGANRACPLHNGKTKLLWGGKRFPLDVNFFLWLWEVVVSLGGLAILLRRQSGAAARGAREACQGCARGVPEVCQRCARGVQEVCKRPPLPVGIEDEIGGVDLPGSEGPPGIDHTVGRLLGPGPPSPQNPPQNGPMGWGLCSSSGTS